MPDTHGRVWRWPRGRRGCWWRWRRKDWRAEDADDSELAHRELTEGGAAQDGCWHAR